MFELNQSLINQSVSASANTQNKQGGINMNNEQMKAMVMEAKKDLMNGLEKLNAIEAMLSESVEVEVEVAPAPVVEQPKATPALDLNAKLLAQFQEKSADMFQVDEPEDDEDLVGQLAKEFGPKDMSRDPEVKVDGGLSIVDEAQAEAIADALDFIDNPEAHEDAVIETEEEEEALAPEETDALAHMTEALKGMFVKSIHEEMDEQDEDDDIDVDLGLTESPGEDPFADVHVPTKREKREQAAAVELELNEHLLSQPAPAPAPVLSSSGVAVISGPMDQSVLYNSARVSYKHDSNDFVVAMTNYLARACNTLYMDGVREFRLPLFNGIELLVPLFWADFKKDKPDARLVLFDNGKSKFQQYKGSIEEEEAAGIFSPRRLALMLIDHMDNIVEVDKNAFQLRELMSAGADAYVRVIPNGRDDAANRFMKKDHKGILICPWSLDVMKTGAYEPKLIQGPGVDFRPKRFQQQQKAGV